MTDTAMTPEPAKARFGRLVAIPLIGFGAAACCAIEFVQTHAPQLGWIPAGGGAMAALIGMVLLLWCQNAEIRAARAARAKCHRIAPYVPQMADGSDGDKALKAVLAVVSRQEIAARGAMVLPATARVGIAPDDTVLHLVNPVPQGGATHRKRAGAPDAFFSAKRFGDDWSDDVKLSRRAEARLEADPFVRRLSRLA